MPRLQNVDEYGCGAPELPQRKQIYTEAMFYYIEPPNIIHKEHILNKDNPCN